VLISRNGQASAYYSTLLRLAGFNNVYSLKFGMASWNQDFADEWVNAVGDDGSVQNYTDTNNPKNDFTDFPMLEEFSSDMSIPEIIHSRIQTIISYGFATDLIHIDRIPYPLDTLENYLVCYGNGSLYFPPRDFIPLGHPPAAILYQDDPVFAFRSARFLQTLPPDKTIIIYGYTGQLSASMVAYLRVLGYNAKTLLFGANQLFHTRMLGNTELIQYAFTGSDINNFPYVMGEE
jgi:rhodanese-related sulfurtransferase